MTYVFDSSALIALLRREPGGVTVNELFEDANNVCLAHSVNMCEVYYEINREYGEQAAQEALQVLYDSGLSIRNDMDEEFWQRAGRIKSAFRRISLADCFCATLADRAGAEMVTSDRHEMQALVSDGICTALFIR